MSVEVWEELQSVIDSIGGKPVLVINIDQLAAHAEYVFQTTSNCVPSVMIALLNCVECETCYYTYRCTEDHIRVVEAIVDCLIDVVRQLHPYSFDDHQLHDLRTQTITKFLM